MMTGFGMGFGLIGLLFMLLFWGGLIALGVWLVKALFSGGQRTPNVPLAPDADPREILARRYARGEITREQYEQMKRDLS